MISPQGELQNSARTASPRKRSSGFTLLELMIAMAIFLVIGAAAVNLFKQHASLFNDQQYQIGLNASLRNALSQMQNDVVNAGTGWYSATNNVSSWPIGITVVNNTAGGSACHPAGTATYNAVCFDTLNVIVPDPTTPPGQVWIAPGTQAVCSSTVLSSSGAMTIAPVAPATQAQLLSGFTATSQVVFIHVTTSGTQMSTAVLTANATANGANVNLQFGATNTDGTNNPGSPPALPPNDKLNLTTQVDTSLVPPPTTNSFCNGSDWVVKVAPIQYTVDTATDPTNPTLTRTESGVPSALASQVIGFKVGASTVDVNGTIASASSSQYCYDSASATFPCYTNHFDRIRSVRISLIGRTPPNIYTNSNTYSTSKFTNAFDQQPYKIESLSIIVNPRNLSMND